MLTTHSELLQSYQFTHSLVTIKYLFFFKQTMPFVSLYTKKRKKPTCISPSLLYLQETFPKHYLVHVCSGFIKMCHFYETTSWSWAKHAKLSKLSMHGKGTERLCLQALSLHFLSAIFCHTTAQLTVS